MLPVDCTFTSTQSQCVMHWPFMIPEHKYGLKTWWCSNPRWHLAIPRWEKGPSEMTIFGVYSIKTKRFSKMGEFQMNLDFKITLERFLRRQVLDIQSRFYQWYCCILRITCSGSGGDCAVLFAARSCTLCPFAVGFTLLKVNIDELTQNNQKLIMNSCLVPILKSPTENYGSIAEGLKGECRRWLSASIKCKRED